MLQPRPGGGERADAAAAREHFARTGDAAAALKITPAWMHVERALLEGYKQHGPNVRAHMSFSLALGTLCSCKW